MGQAAGGGRILLLVESRPSEASFVRAGISGHHALEEETGSRQITASLCIEAHFVQCQRSAVGTRKLSGDPLVGSSGGIGIFAAKTLTNPIEGIRRTIVLRIELE